VMGQWLIRVLIIGALGVIAVGFHTQAPLAMLHCPPNEYQNDGQTEPENCAPLYILGIRSVSDLWTGTGEFIERNREDINALSTVAIAVFTGTLWFVTWGMVRIAKDQRTDTLRAIAASARAAAAAEQSAEAAIGVELPRILIHDIRFECGIETIRVNEGNIKYGNIVVTIRNIGRTTAIISQVCLETFVGWYRAERFECNLAADIAAVGLEHNKTHAIEVTAFPKRFRLETINEILDGKIRLWAYGFVFYFDFLGLPNWFRFEAHFQVDPLKVAAPHFVVDFQRTSHTMQD